MDSHETPPTNHCQFCSRSFVRQEHLTRHLRTHTKEKPYRCSRCDKAFSRQDVLQKHELMHKSEPAYHSIVSSRACKECAAGRTRCSRELPCKRCQDRRLECIYPARKRRKLVRQAGTESSTSASSQTPGQGRDEGHGIGVNAQVEVNTSGGAREANTPGNNAGEWHIEQSVIEVRGLDNPSSISPNDGDWPVATAPTDILPSQGSRTAFEIDDLGDFSLDNGIEQPMLNLSATNWLSNTQDISMWDNQLSEIPFGLGSIVGMEPIFAAPAPVPSSWLPDQSADSNTLNVAGPSLTTSYTTGGALQSPLPAESIPSAATSKSTGGTLYVDGTEARAPFRGQSMRQRRASSAVTDAMHGASHGISLLGNESPMSTGGAELYAPLLNLVSDTAYHEMVRMVRCQADIHAINVDPTSIPPIGHIRCFVRLYYQKFHPTYPFVHRDCFKASSTSSSALLLAVSATGARYFGGPWPKSLSALVNELLGTLLKPTNRDDDDDVWLPGGPETPNQVDLMILQAVVLNLICRLHSGRSVVVEQALSHRLYLTNECRRMNLLCRVPSKMDPMPNTDAAAAITAWLQAETEIRLGMMIWVLDSMLAYEFDSPSILHLHEAKSPLPCPDEIWDHPTLVRITGRDPRTATISEALDALYMEKQQPPNLTEFSTLILIHAVCRRSREVLYQHETALSRWVPISQVQPRQNIEPIAEMWPPNLPILARWRNSACDCLDILHWKANGTAANAGGSEHSTILHLHLSRLHLLTPYRHLQGLPAALSRCMKRGNDLDRSSYAESCTHLHRWANLDQYKARLSMVHAGALWWHVRRYSSNGFIEPYAIYLATLSIWAYSVFTRSQQVNHTPDGAPEPHISPNPIDAVAISSENDNEIPEPQFIHLDRPCDDETVQMYIRLGHKMKGYMLRVGDVCSTDAPPKILSEGIRLLSIERDKERLWGLEQGFVKSLESLLHMTTGKGPLQADIMC